MEDWLPAFATAIEASLEASATSSKDALHQRKHRIARELKVPRVPQDPELIPHFSEAGREKWAALLRKKPMRSQSGVAIVAVMSSPAGCPHGKCI